MILVFVFAIITLVLSIKAFRSIGMGGINKNYLIAGIFAIVTIVLCVIGTMQATTYGNTIYFTLTGTTLAGGFGYTWGFVLAIIAMIFFFINYAIDIFMLQTGVGIQKSPMYQQQQQPQVMYTSQQPPPMQQTPPPQEPVQQTPPPVQQPPVQQTPPPPVQEQTQAGTIFCPNCGAQLAANIKFCSGCGHKL